MKVLESRETPGLGDKIYKDAKFVAEFRELVVDPVIELIKGHGERANQVDAITGATISSRAVVKILNQTNTVWRPRIAALAAQPPAARATRAGRRRRPRASGRRARRAGARRSDGRQAMSSASGASSPR